MPFFHYRQNNSGGEFHLDETVCKNVIIEAPDAKYADFLFERNTGVDIESHGYCPCCGPRWVSAWGEGDSVPSIYDQPVEEYIISNSYGDPWCKIGEPYAIVYYFDGSKKIYRR